MDRNFHAARVLAATAARTARRASERFRAAGARVRATELESLADELEHAARAEFELVEHSPPPTG